MIDPIELQPLSKTDKVKSVRITMSGRQQLVFKLVDDHARAVDLVHQEVKHDAPVPDYSPRPPTTPQTVNVRLRAVDQFYNGTAQFDVPGVISTDCPGVVIFQLDGQDTCRPGIFKAEVGQFVTTGPGQVLVNSWPVFVTIEPTVFIQISGVGPLTIPEIRLGIGDLNVEEVSLLDDLEFTDSEIMYCIRQAVDIWNETPPHIYTFTAFNFPYRYHWIRGTCALLYKIAVKKYTRNQLAYSAGGVTIDDQNKQQQYTAIANELDQEFRTWMMREKIRLNMDLAWHSGI